MGLTQMKELLINFYYISQFSILCFVGSPYVILPSLISKLPDGAPVGYSLKYNLTFLQPDMGKEIQLFCCELMKDSN